MFYYNTRWAFKLADDSPPAIAGGIIAASALTRPQLIQRARKTVKHHPYLQHRLFDSQLYLADIDAQMAAGAVVNLGTYPWFRCAPAEYQSSQQVGGVAQWKAEQSAQLLATWPRTAATDPREIAECTRASIEHQHALGCEAIILPSPMTRTPGTYVSEAAWIDAGLDACRELRVVLPVYATIAIADTALRQQTPGHSPFLQTVSAQIAARPGLAGAYIVLAQETEDGYCCKVPDTLLALLLLTDDLVRGAGRDVIVNYMGTFGAVATGAGAKIWATGYNRSQRRLRSSDMDDTTGRQYPRYFSAELLGDVGLEEELDLVAAHAVRSRVMFDSPSAAQLNQVLRSGGRVSDVAEWQYRQGNSAAAAAHYNSVMHHLGMLLEGIAPERRVDVVHKVLIHAERVASQVSEAITMNGRRTRGYTDITPQQIWRTTYENWRCIAGV